MGNQINSDSTKLSDMADYFIEKYCQTRPDKLDEFIEKMKNIFTIRKVESHHTTIASLPWRRIYTTNYDNVIEEAAKQKNIRIESKDLKDKTDNKCCCLHINGQIDKLTKESLNNSFKLTHSSYISHEAFYNTSWKNCFINDIELSAVVIFIGYSLYDIDIEKILFESNRIIRDKVIFIQGKNTDDMTAHKLSKYGRIFSIEAKDFAHLIEKYTLSQDDIEETYLECFQEYQLIRSIDQQIDENGIENFLMLGKIEDNYIQAETIRQLRKPPFLISRYKINKALEKISNNQILIILGDIGNGKTIFLKQLATKLAENETVFILNEKIDSLIAKRDIDKIIKNNKQCVVIIDSYTNHIDLIDYISLQKYENMKIILATRLYAHYRTLKEKEYLNNANILEVDTLNESEIEDLYNIIENVAMWRNLTNKNKSFKLKIMKEDCKSEISLILTHILESEQMTNKIKKIVERFLLDNQKSAKQLFAICLLNYMNIPISIDLLEEMVGEHDLSIYQDDNLENLAHINLIEKDNRVATKSSIFSLLILKKCFEGKITVFFLEILKQLERKNDIPYLDEVRKNLLRFRFIERLLPENGKRNTLVKYYENLKKEFHNLMKDPQYWLQYAMCFIMSNELDKAQDKLDTAYNKAKYTNYDATKIDNQQARLHLKKASQIHTDIKEAVELFLKASNLLTKQQENDIYKYKIMMDYKDFIDNRCNSFNQTQWNQIANLCEKQLKDLERNIKQERFKDVQIYEKCRKMLEEILTIKRKHYSK